MELLNDLYMSQNDLVSHFSLRQNVIFPLDVKILKGLNPPSSKCCVDELMCADSPPRSARASSQDTGPVCA